MKTTLFSLIALGVAAAMGGPVDRAAAGEPVVLSAEQLDRVTAGSHVRRVPYLVYELKDVQVTSSRTGGGIFNSGGLAIADSVITRHTPEWTDFNTHDPGRR